MPLVYALFTYIPVVKEYEKVDGTVRHAWRFLATAIITQTLYVLLFWVLAKFYYFEDPTVLYESTVGIWPVVFADIVIECHRVPDVPRK
jgi:hypothetical protein